MVSTVRFTIFYYSAAGLTEQHDRPVRLRFAPGSTRSTAAAKLQKSCLQQPTLSKKSQAILVSPRLIARANFFVALRDKGSARMPNPRSHQFFQIDHTYGTSH